LIKSKIATPLEIGSVYLILTISFFAYYELAKIINPCILFVLFWIIIISIVVVTDKRILNFIKEKIGRIASPEGQ
jgi:F0F1-type ATP synthase membrane subunit b/b'